MASQAERNARLDALKKAVVEYADRQKARLQKQVKRNQQKLDGRGGSDGLAHSSVQASEELVVDEISTFLTG